MTDMTLLEQHDYGYGEANESADNLTKTSYKLWLYFGITLLAFGTVGHVLSLLVVIGSKRMRLLSLSVYIATSSIVGLCVLYVGLLRQILLTSSDYDDIRNHSSDAWCRFHAALTFFSLQLYAWVQASVAVDRTIAIWLPTHYKRWFTPLTSALAVVALVTFLAPFSSIVIISYHLDNEQQCRASDHEYGYLIDTVWAWLDLVLYSVFPASVLIPCNAMTIYGTCRSGAFQKKASASFSIAKSYQLTAMLLIHNVVYFITTVPISILFLFPSTTVDGNYLTWTIGSLVQYVGTIVGFIIYIATAGEFRKAITELLRKGFNAEVSSERDRASTNNFLQREKDNTTQLRMANLQFSNLNAEVTSRPLIRTADEEESARTVGASCEEKLINCQDMSLCSYS